MCFSVVLKISFSNNLHIVDKRLIELKFWGNLGICRISADLLDFRVRVRVTLRLAIYRQTISLGTKPLEAHKQRFFFSTAPLRS
jgi:hypothetical protein